jgi:hypothetical protein
MTYDDWKTDAPDPGTVEDKCACGNVMHPGEYEQCSVCAHEYYDNLRDEYAPDEDCPEAA